jgi:hypothetical protein
MTGMGPKAEKLDLSITFKGLVFAFGTLALMAVEVTKRLWEMEDVYCYAAGVEGNDPELDAARRSRALSPAVSTARPARPRHCCGR